MSETQGPYPVIDQWREVLQHKGKSDHTLAAYRHAVRHFVVWSEMLYGQDFDPASIIGTLPTPFLTEMGDSLQLPIAARRYFAWNLRILYGAIV